MTERLKPYQMKVTRKAPPPKVTFKVTGFRNLHGHQPRGDAFWIFYFGNEPTEPWIARDAGGHLLCSDYLTSKRIATDEARRRGTFYVTVDAMPL